MVYSMIKRFVSFFLSLMLILILLAPANVRSESLANQFAQLEADFAGNIGVYVKSLEDGSTVTYNTDRLWYLASTVKIPIAIAILQRVENGEFSLSDELAVKESDYVDGSGDLLWQEPGSSHTIRELLIRMIRDSDSVAADMLLRHIGEEAFNRQIQDRIVNEGFEHITTILEVRYDAYSNLHENVWDLSNVEIIQLQSVNPLDARLEEFMRLAGIEENELNAPGIAAAFEEYYESNINSGNLISMGLMLERLAEGEYLNEEHTQFLLDVMTGITTGDDRIKAGLPEGTRFAQKTGTQIRRAVNVGIIYPPNGDPPIVVAACTEKVGWLAESERVLAEIGRIITEEWIK